MKRKHGVALFLTIAATIAAGLWLSFTAMLAVGAVLPLFGVVLFRKPAWRNASLLLTSVLLGLSALNFAFWLIAPKPFNEGVVKMDTPEKWIIDDDIVGYKLKPGITVDATSKYRDQILFHAKYTIEPSGARATPGSQPNGPTYLFIGDSLVFSETLEDSQTMASQFAQNLRPGAHVVNLGVPGYGLNNLVRAVETGQYDPYVVGKVAAVITWIAPYHMERVTGDGDWLTLSPHYELIPGQPPRYTGSFLAWRLSHPLEGLSYFARSRFSWVMRIVGPNLERRQEILYVALIERLRDLVRQKWNAPLIIVYDWADGTITDQNDERLRPVYESIAALGMPMVSMRRLSLPHVGWPEFTIPHDGHPSALMDRTVARGLFDKARELGLQ